MSPETYTVWRVPDLDIAYLDPFPVIDYTNESYRVAVNDSAEVSRYFQLHDREQAGYYSLIQPHFRRGMTVVDCGCGGGSLLDLIKGLAGRTIGIEPFAGYHADLRARGHEVCRDLDEAEGRFAATADLALSVHVIEHTTDPVDHLSRLRRIVRPGGRILVLTPNLDDLLLTIDPDRFAPFFFRKVHTFYFTSTSLAMCAQRAGLEVQEILYYHEFGLANALLWLRDGKPSGHQPLADLGRAADAFWKGHLEASGQSNQVGAVLVNL